MATKGTVKESETSIRYTWYIFMERQFHELDFFCKIAVLRALVVKGFSLLEDDTIHTGGSKEPATFILSVEERCNLEDGSYRCMRNLGLYLSFDMMLTSQKTVILGSFLLGTENKFYATFCTYSFPRNRALQFCDGPILFPQTESVTVM